MQVMRFEKNEKSSELGTFVAITGSAPGDKEALYVITMTPVSEDKIILGGMINYRRVGQLWGEGRGPIVTADSTIDEKQNAIAFALRVLTSMFEVQVAKAEKEG